jgi:AcrR family transcriptional regulator
MTAPSPRRRTILRAAERLFEHYGLGKTTIADVAREAGVGVGTVYLEFAGKEAIVEELSRAKHETVLSAMRAASTRPDLTLLERVAAVFDARLAATFGLARAGMHACDLVRCRGEGPVAEASAAFLAEQRVLIVELVRLGARAKEIDSSDPDTTADALLACYATFSAPHVLGREEAAAHRELARVHSVVLYGLARRPRG